MGKIVFFIALNFLVTSVWAQEASCRFDGKDYSSPGYSLPKRQGFYIKGRFGCRYVCTCPDGDQQKVSHILEEKHLDLDIFSQDTGGASRAKWFICPYSVKNDSWKPIYDMYGDLIAYSVEPNYNDFPASWLESSPQVQNWLQNSCQKP